MRAAVVVVGDEILSGHVQDANGHYIAQRLADHGHRLRSLSVVSDDPMAIAAAVRRELPSAEIVFVCGGVGPTHDDRTMEGVAGALGLPLETSAPIAERVEQILSRVAEQGLAGDPLGGSGLRKMALVPRGAEVLPSSIGLIPAVAIDVGGRVVVVLPGPPRELQIVFRDAVEPRYLAGTGDRVHREEITHPYPESTIAAELDALQRQTPGVSIGSYPMEGHSLVRISGAERDVGAVAARVRAFLADLDASEHGKGLLDYLKGRRRA